MARRVPPWCFSLVLAAAGCFASDQPNNLLVQPSPFGSTPVTTPAKTAYAPAPSPVAQRVSDLGKKIIAANQGLGLKPAFNTIGDPKAELFHTGQHAIWITEGLVKQCPTDRLLAAVLCSELGKMVSEREALAGPTRRTDEDPPIQMPVGNDSGGTFGAADATALAERAKYEQDRRRPNQPPAPPPDPVVLAGVYLGKAGYHATDLDDVRPILKAAQANFAWEKQFSTGSPPVKTALPPNP
jgi:hypothetical protein